MQQLNSTTAAVDVGISQRIAQLQISYRPAESGRTISGGQPKSVKKPLKNAGGDLLNPTSWSPRIDQLLPFIQASLVVHGGFLSYETFTTLFECSTDTYKQALVVFKKDQERSQLQADFLFGRLLVPSKLSTPFTSSQREYLTSCDRLLVSAFKCKTMTFVIPSNSQFVFLAIAADPTRFLKVLMKALMPGISISKIPYFAKFEIKTKGYQPHIHLVVPAEYVKRISASRLSRAFKGALSDLENRTGCEYWKDEQGQLVEISAPHICDTPLPTDHRWGYFSAYKKYDIPVLTKRFLSIVGADVSFRQHFYGSPALRKMVTAATYRQTVAVNNEEVDSLIEQFTDLVPDVRWSLHGRRDFPIGKRCKVQVNQLETVKSVISDFIVEHNLSFDLSSNNQSLTFRLSPDGALAIFRGRKRGGGSNYSPASSDPVPGEAIEQSISIAQDDNAELFMLTRKEIREFLIWAGATRRREKFSPEKTNVRHPVTNESSNLSLEEYRLDGLIWDHPP